MTESYVTLKPEELEKMLERAAHKGARRALETVGLQDNEALDDVREIRSFIRDWRVIRSGILRAFGRVLFWGILVLVATFGVKTGTINFFGGKS